MSHKTTPNVYQVLGINQIRISSTELNIHFSLIFFSQELVISARVSFQWSDEGDVLMIMIIIMGTSVCKCKCQS